MNVPRPGGECPRRAESEEEMTASNGIRTENKIKRLAAAVALAVMAILGISCLSPARADAAGTSDGNLVIDVPTTVPCALMADGTVVSPSEWKITTSGDAYIASASASGFPANVEWSAKTTDLAAAQAGSVRVAGTGDVASVSGPSDPAAAALAPSAGFEWSFSKLDAGKNSNIIGKAASGTAVLGSVTFTFAKAEPDSFAVYSADDNSLSFYKRADVPVADQMFEGKTATEVYTGLETMTSIPGWTQNHFNDIKTVMVYDKGIAPTGTAFWFAGVRNLKTADVSKLDMSRCKTIECMFTDCISLETLDLSGWDTSSLTSMSQAFHHCASLTKLNVSGWDVSKVTNMQLAFAEDKALGSLDLSTWDNSAATSMKDAFLQMDSLNEISLGSKFKFVGTNGYLPTPSSAYIAGADGKWYDTDGIGYVPADIPSNKAMTYTAVAPKKAFAVYSADDNSLNFYKRSSVPVAGQAFEGKTATEVYTGFETKTSIPGWMLNYSSSIKTVTVCDEGIAPIGTGHWFAELRNMKTADVSKLDMSKCKTISCMFTDCTSLETLDLSAWDTRSLTSMGQAFQNCTSLTKLNVSGWDVSKVTDMDLAFAEDRALSSLDLSTWDNSAATTMKDVFSMMDSLSEVSLGSKFKFVGTNGYLPTPSSAYIAGADGKWYDADGNGYAPADIPSNKAMTYTAVAPKKAFAVYSADDDSLNLYKRAAVPAAGKQFEGKTATEVYEGVEKASYTAADGAPWSGHTAELASMKVADEGIAPVSTAYWFKGASKLKSVSLAGLDTSQTTCMDGMFDGCSSLESLDLSAMSTRRVASMTAFLGGCDSLAELSLGSEFAWVDDDCYPPTGDWKQGSTGTDYSESDIPANKTDKYTRAKTACAIYSADDQSLTFYKRPVAPTEGAQFLGKTASKVFTGFETGTYSPSSVPWAAYRSNLKTVTVADEGIAPVSTANWFFSFTNVESINLSKLDTSNVTSIACMFYCCESLTSLNLSSFDTGKVTDMRSVFQDCKSLTSLDLSSFDTGNVTNMICLFSECDSLERISLGTGFKWVGTNGYLPTPSSTYIAGADGKWYDADGNGFAPADIPSNKAMTYTAVAPKSAFAVYSADDDSLSFYKRAGVPSAGKQFEGKTVTEVYTGFETETYGLDNSAPWSAHYNRIETVVIADDGIAPKSTASWFKGFYSLRSADVSKLDMSKCKDVSYMFYECNALGSINISTWDTSSFENVSYMLGYCRSLRELDVLGWNVSNITNMEEVFFACSNVRTLDISTWDNSKTENMNLAFGGMSHLEKIKLGDKFNWIGDGPRLPYPNDEFIPTVMTNKWYAESTGAEYSPENIPSLKADTYYASQALRDAAVGATSDPVDDDSTAVPAVASTCKAQGESATQKAVEGVPPLEGKASKESDTATKPEGAEKDAEAKPALENEATKEDISAIVPEGAEKTAVKKSGE